MAEGKGGSIEIQDRVSERLNRIISTMERLINTSQALDSAMARVGNTISQQADHIASANNQLLNSVADVSADIQSDSVRAVQSLDAINDLDFKPFETNSAQVLSVLDGVDAIKLDKVESEIDSTTSALERMADVANQVNKVNAMDTSPLQQYADQGILQFDSIGSEMAKLSQYLSRIRDESSSQPLEIPLSFDSSALNSFEPPQFEPIPLEMEWIPVEQPEVFTTTGVERYQQELGSVNSLLNQASIAQSELNSQAIDLKASPAMQADFANMTERIQGISNEIAKLEANPIDDVVSPSVSNELESLRASLTQITRAQEEVANGLADVNVDVAHRAYNQLNTEVGQVERRIRDNINAQNDFNQSLDVAIDSSSRLMSVIRKIAVAIGASKALKGAVNLSDTYAQTNARLDLMNDGLQTTAQLQDMVFASAQRSRMEYQATADMVSKLGLLAGDAFANSGEIVNFAELINKQFTIAGTSAQEAAGATLQLTQALASGVLRGDELNSVMEQAPTIIQSIADYLNVSKGEIRDLASEGLITADIVKNAMFAAADDINAQFESMPKTWSQVWTQFQNSANNALEPILQRINDLANSEGVQTFVNNAVVAINMLVNITLVAIDIIGGLFSFIASQWAWLGPILMAIVSILVLHYGHILLVRGAVMLATIATNAWTAAVAIYQAATGSALLLTISLIILVIGAIYAVVGAFNMLTGSTVSGLGVIMGGIYALGAVVLNVGIAIVNIVLGIVQFIVNLFQAGLFVIQMLWFGLQIAIGGVALVILTTVQMLVNGIGSFFTTVLNFISEQWFYLGMNVGILLANMLDNVSGFANSALDAFNQLKFGAETAWYNIAKGAGNMATAIAQGIDGMINSVIGGIEGMLNSVLGGINDMISALDKIPGVNIGPIGAVSLGRSGLATGVGEFTSNIKAPTAPESSNIDLGNSLRESLADKRPPTKKDWNDVDLTSGLSSWLQNNIAPEAPEQWTPEYLDFLSITDSYNSGYAQGEKWESQLSDLLGKLKDGASTGSDLSDIFNDMPGVPDVPAAPDLTGGGGGSGGGGNPSGGRLDSVGEIEDEIGLEDDVKDLLIAYRHQRWQQNFITMTPNVTNNVEIATDEEYEDFIAKFNDDIADAIYDAMDGVPAN